MKKLVLLFGIFFFGFASLALTQPDPRDSVILESKSVLPGGGNPAFTMRVYITNKDSLTFLTLAVKEQTASGNAYVHLVYPWCGCGILNCLTNTLCHFCPLCIPDPNRYDGVSPDWFLVAGGFDPVDPTTIEPPNAVRKAVWEIKFDSVLPDPGTVEFDSSIISGVPTQFTTTEPRDIPVNFVKGVITVLPQADPRDSVILESKVVLPGAGDPAFTMKVYITNKDSLTGVILALKKTRITEEADVFIPYTCCPNRFTNYLTNTLRNYGACIPECDIVPFENPDTLITWATWNYYDDSTIEPPNAVRKALLEIKFDTAYSQPGDIEFDSARVFGSIFTYFNSKASGHIPVNFVKSVITVRPKGDFNLDGGLSGADVVELLNCVFDMGMQGEGAYPCDLNCDSKRSPADVILELYAVFMGQGFPC